MVVWAISQVILLCVISQVITLSAFRNDSALLVHLPLKHAFGKIFEKLLHGGDSTIDQQNAFAGLRTLEIITDGGASSHFERLSWNCARLLSITESLILHRLSTGCL